MDTTVTVAVLGASNKEDRYSYMALDLLLRKGYRAIPIHPHHGSILGQVCYPKLTQVPHPIDTLTLYVGSRHLPGVLEDIVRISPRRVIFNPGTENKEVRSHLENVGILCQEACTLVLLHTNQF